MLTFSRDPQIAERQMQAIIFSLTTFGHIDGDFDDKERAFVRDYIGKLVAHRVKTGLPDADEATAKDLVGRFSKHFLETFENIERFVAETMTEPVGKDESRDAFVHAKLKLRCFELFKSFDRGSQEALLETVDEFIMADGHMHPAETKFRSELSGLLYAEGAAPEEVAIELEPEGEPSSVRLSGVMEIRGAEADHAFFKQFEHHYSSDQGRMLKQVGADLHLVDKCLEKLREQKAAGAGKLEGKKTVADLVEPLRTGGSFLDGHTYAIDASHPAGTEIVVLGDLHGCYSCLKAAVMQTDFFAKVEAFRADPTNTPKPLFVLLGDYIDRGIFSLNGVLRSVMQLFVTAPEHVFALRGNHEYYVEVKGQIYGGVRPAEAINTLKPYLSIDVFRKYMELYEAMPNVLLFDRLFFVHGGIPRDRALKEKWKDLSTLNDADLRFQMMWSDPSSTDVIPAALQDQTARFPFGRLQFQSFMQRTGCNTLIRGHEKVEEGVRASYDEAAGKLLTVFSAGGEDNNDLPEGSSYRGVKPMALRIVHRPAGVGRPPETEIQPFALDWAKYNDPEHNGFFKAPMEIEHRME